MKSDIVILGAGLSGLSVAAHLRDALPDEEILIIEKSQFVGGLCRSIRKDGFTYDYSGHLLHLRQPEIRRWVFELLKKNLREVERDSRIFSEGRLTKYPYQMNLYGLPVKTIKECLSGLVETHLKGNNPDPSGSFLKWSIDTFGVGITKHFMKPYNEKLFRFSSRKFNAEWCGGFVPRPSLEDVIMGSVSDDAQKGIGYNARFFYPQNSGIQSLIDAICGSVEKGVEIRLGVFPVKIDLSTNKITLSDGKTVRYRHLVSTIPLPDFARLCGMNRYAEGLHATSVVCFNIGVKGKPGHNIHWIYFPEEKFNFYRVGFYSNINPSSAPSGFYSMYVEVSLPHRKKPDDISRMLEESVSGLKRAGLISSAGDIVSLDIRHMPGAYVVYDFDRAHLVNKIKKYLSDTTAYLLGRYGLWKYSYMEESIYEAKLLAREISSNYF